LRWLMGSRVSQKRSRRCPGLRVVEGPQAILPAIYRAENAYMAWSGSRSSRPNRASAIRQSVRPDAGPGAVKAC
jgi:hypothetical protein